MWIIVIIFSFNSLKIVSFNPLTIVMIVVSKYCLLSHSESTQSPFLLTAFILLNMDHAFLFLCMPDFLLKTGHFREYMVANLNYDFLDLPWVCLYVCPFSHLPALHL